MIMRHHSSLITQESLLLAAFPLPVRFPQISLAIFDAVDEGRSDGAAASRAKARRRGGKDDKGKESESAPAAATASASKSGLVESPSPIAMAKARRFAVLLSFSRSREMDWTLQDAKRSASIQSNPLRTALHASPSALLPPCCARRRSRTRLSSTECARRTSGTLWRAPLGPPLPSAPSLPSPLPTTPFSAPAGCFLPAFSADALTLLFFDRDPGSSSSRHFSSAGPGRILPVVGVDRRRGQGSCDGGVGGGAPAAAARQAAGVHRAVLPDDRRGGAQRRVTGGAAPRNRTRASFHVPLLSSSLSAVELCRAAPHENQTAPLLFPCAGAVIHYRPVEGSCRAVGPQSLLLLDSGGQYDCGTTDVTRTTHLGYPSPWQRECFTRVLQGHIALDKMVFPEGIPGFVLDAFARRALWEAGLDYRHGTGHGVGAALNVHEGPQGISPRFGNMTGLQASMVVSNEPGYYEDGAFGIRIENLQIVAEASTAHRFGGTTFLGFERLTLVPIQAKARISRRRCPHPASPSALPGPFQWS